VQGLVSLAEQVLPGHDLTTRHLQIAALGGEQPRLLMRRESASLQVAGKESEVWDELRDDVDGGLAIQEVVSGVVREQHWAADGTGTAEPAATVEPPPFSTREQQVAGLMGRGLSDRAVARELWLSPKTVEKHVSAVLRKTGTSSRTAAVVRCIEMGWL
ncbi:MAG: LuxR C-terminal-related transcriptional regulator, partial [Ornithinimicrobium sp.]